MLARRDTQTEASRLRRLSPLRTLEDQSQIRGIRCHSCTGREGLPPSWKLSYKTYVLRFTRESKFSFNQRIARSLPSYSHGLRKSRRHLHRERTPPVHGCHSYGHIPRSADGHKCLSLSRFSFWYDAPLTSRDSDR